MSQLKNLRDSDRARMYGREPKVHYPRDAYPGDKQSLCGRSVYGTETDNKVDCKFCLKIKP